LEQAVLTLNLLRGSRINPKISAWAQLFGKFDYNANPIQPPGVNVLVHDKPTDRDSWDLHASAGWYIGPEMKGYRTVKCFMKGTQAVRTLYIVVYMPDKLPVPAFTNLVPPVTATATPLRVSTDVPTDIPLLPPPETVLPLRVAYVPPHTPVTQVPVALRVPTVATSELPGSFAALTNRRQRRSTARRAKQVAKKNPIVSTIEPPTVTITTVTDRPDVLPTINILIHIHINVNFLVLHLLFQRIYLPSMHISDTQLIPTPV
jgi:hypothetical protein